MKKGKVYIIGVGPGDYRLMSLKAADCISYADAVVYDRLIDSRVLKFAPENAEFIDAGKLPGFHSVPQEEINKILARLAAEGKTVARVKGGDPFLFGRGGEECEFLRKHGIEFEVVPGITSAIAVPAYAGIPVTHRDYASSFHIITGHKSDENDDVSIDFETVSKLEGTIVFLMGMKNLRKICQGLLKYGKSSETPAAVIQNGASYKQKVILGTLGDIFERSVKAVMTAPCVIVVGSVAKLAEKLAWMGKEPLYGQSIVLTRPAGQSAGLAKKLEELGAHVVELPVVKIVEVDDYKPLERALKKIREYGWLVFTSVNGVNIFFRQMKKLKKDIRLLAGLKLAAVGPATAEALMEKGLNVEFIPEVYTTWDLMKGLLEHVEPGEKVLLARAENASSELSVGLKNNNIGFDEVIVYRTIVNETCKPELLRLLGENSIDFITFTSPSTVEGFISIAGAEIIRNCGTRVVCIGPVTANTASIKGLTVSGCAEEYDENGIVRKIIELSEVCHGID